MVVRPFLPCGWKRRRGKGRKGSRRDFALHRVRQRRCDHRRCLQKGDSPFSLVGMVVFHASGAGGLRCHGIMASRVGGDLFFAVFDVRFRMETYSGKWRV